MKVEDLFAFSRRKNLLSRMREPFQRYHADNPSIWTLFERFAFEALNAGRETLSAKLIFERIRWETTVIARGDPFKLNNNYHADYARFFMLHYPQHDGAFRTRELRAGQGEPYYDSGWG